MIVCEVHSSFFAILPRWCQSFWSQEMLSCLVEKLHITHLQMSLPPGLERGREEERKGGREGRKNNYNYVEWHSHLSCHHRRRSVQLHYAASDCQPTRCPRSEQQEADAALRAKRDDKLHYFDCDPSCVEPSYWYFRKGELLVAGKDFGGHYI